MLKKIVKKIALGALALTCTFGCVGTFTACDEGSPEAMIVLEFNGQDYVLSYQLHNDKTPKTVNHFIWLVQNQYYDGMCIHDYQMSKNRLFTGAYSLDENGDLEYEDYYETVTSSPMLASFPHTVWGDKSQENPRYTLYGEFKENNYSVGFENSGVLKQQYGSLSMYYDSEGDENAKVWVQNMQGQLIERKEMHNSATSIFYISTVTSATTNRSHCTFATLNNPYTLETLEDAIEEYIGDNEEDWFVTETPDSNNSEIIYQLPNEPIIVKSVRITKYA